MFKQFKGKRNPLSRGMKPVLHWVGGNTSVRERSRVSFSKS